MKIFKRFIRINCYLFIVLALVLQLRQHAAAEKIRDFHLLTSAEIASELKDLATQYPQFATLSTSQEAFGLPAAGSSSDCTFDVLPGCQNYFLTIIDSIAHPPDSLSAKHLPDVFLSGALHGNERVGPTATLEAAKILLEAADCESFPRFVTPPEDLDSEEGSEWSLQVQKAIACRENLAQIGISDAQRKWLARLVTTRRIVISPMTNALGYDQNKREEGLIDPNRDFPFDQSPTECMQTIAGRTVNELFQSHLFQMSLTFHAGTEVVGYEWGAFPFKNTSPDDVALKEIASSYARYAGNFDGTPVYRTGTMNDLVYPVKGGMEDWAYAGSWETRYVLPCEPSTFGGYPITKTTYNNSTLRAFNMLIETSDSKIPHSHLGNNQHLLDQDQYEYNGHVSRNIRLALMAIELVQPYVYFWGVNRVPLQDDIVPMMRIIGSSILNCKRIVVPQGRTTTTLAWAVGGGITVDETHVVYSKFEDNYFTTIDPADENFNLTEFTEKTQVSSGPSRWQVNWRASFEGLPDGWEVQDQPLYFASIDTSDFAPGDKIIAYAIARFDQEWKKSPDNSQPLNIKPSSHVVNARTTSNWRHESADKIVQGKLDFVSLPIILVIGNKSNDTVIDLSDRFIPSNNFSTHLPDKSGDIPSRSSFLISEIILISVAIIVLSLVLVSYLRRGAEKKKYEAARRLTNILDDEQVFELDFTTEEDIELQEGTWT